MTLSVASGAKLTCVTYLAVCHVILIGMLCGLGHKVHHRFVLCIYSSRIFTLHTLQQQTG